MTVTANWNSWHGCHKWSAGCQNCYVYRSDTRHGRDASAVYRTGDFDLPVRKNRQGEWKVPDHDLCWTCFTSDFLLEDADPWRAEAWEMIRRREEVTFFFITKRISRLTDCLPDDWGDGYPNVQVGCTMENQAEADKRMPLFIDAPIRTKIIVCEPLLTPLDLSPWLGPWFSRLVAGGESGEEARPCRFEWILSLRDQCDKAGVPFWFKQTGARFVKDGRLYRIPRRLQHSQARKAGLNTGPQGRNNTQ